MTTMELFLVRAGSLRLAVAASQVARVEPCPPGLNWPPSPDGVMGWAPLGHDARAACVVDAATRWRTDETPTIDGQREKPATALVLAGGALALAVDGYDLASRPVYAGPAVLQVRGVHALTPQGDGFAIVLDMSRIVV